MLVRTKKRREDWIEQRSARSYIALEEKQWTKLWKTQVLSELRVFLWMLAHQSLPTGDVRQHRNMAETSQCLVCGDEYSWRHSLLDCNMSRCVWNLLDEEVTQHMIICVEPKQWLFTFTETLKHDQFIQVVVTLWALWYARRQLIHDGEHQSPLSTFLFARRFIDDLSLAPK
jgi:hypothetical protein